MKELITELNTNSTSLNRFSLKGPTSKTALSRLIGPSPLHDAKSSEIFSFFHRATQSAYLSAIWQAGLSLAVNIQDPRLQSNSYQQPATWIIEKETTNSIIFPIESSLSPLWDSSMTTTIVEDFRSDFAVNKEKRSYAKAAWQAHFLEKDVSKTVENRILECSFKAPFVKSPIVSAYCPIILIRQEQKVAKRLMRGRSKHSLLSGWDIIVPAVWGQTIWRALQKPFMIDRFEFTLLLALKLTAT